MFSLCLLPNSKFDFIKAGTVLCSFLGIVIVTYSDRDENGQSWSKGSTFYGDALSLLSAVFYGLYSVSLTRRVPEDE